MLHPLITTLTLLVLLLTGCGGGGTAGSSSGSDGSGDTATVQAPAITTQPLSQTLSSGGSATLTVVASGGSPLSYQWLRGGVAIDGATSATLVTTSTGSYTVTVSNSAGSVTSSTAVVVATTASGSGWNLATGEQPADNADTSSYLRLSLALDTGVLTATSARLVVGATSAGSTPVLLDGSGVLTVVRDAFGFTITATLPEGSNPELVLTGSATTSVTVYSSTDFKLTLADATINSPDGPALNIQSRQRAFVTLSGSSTLTGSSTWSARTLPDGGSMDLKAVLFSEGPLIVDGNGSLAVSAAARHALASDRHLRLRSGSLTVASAAKDGVRANDAFVMDGGSLTITTPAGKGIKVEGRESSTAALGFITINAGTLAITSHDKAITASWEAEDGDTATLADDPDPRVTINGGTITIRTTGTPYEDRNTADGDDSLSPEGIEAKSVLTINGGTLRVETTDDALNAGSAIVITGGRLLARSSANDAIDSNGTLSISGGIVVAEGAGRPEGALDADNATVAITGGLVVGIGGHNSTVTASASTQNSVSLRDVAAGLLVLRDDNGNAAFAYTLPRAASAMVLSSPLLTTGTRYTVVSAGTLGAVGELFEGLAINPSTHSGGTAGTSFTLSGRVTGL
ncbi:carbohydrate-binding domain-containing protein [Pseudorhodoferax sp.]|uniref:carbohydrate-binding domain-containing protein n=1 Tax=Pseudorhodoferax sp. TaxID=1993553 RepID=UPI002DD62327|nr:carbohydrate-binding domain-containing protein [Pseudorhodoferax sp.]